MTDIFDDFTFDHDVVGRCYLTNPISGKRIVAAVESTTPIECYIDMLGFHSAKAQEWRRKSEEKQRQLEREFTTEEREQDMREMLASLTVGWQLVAPNGKPVLADCTFENVLQFYVQHDWVILQLANFLGQLGNFVPDGWIN